MAPLKVIKPYPWGNDEELLEETELHCPNCGEQNVHVQDAEGDYYHGPNYYCTKCRFMFKLPSCCKMMDKWPIVSCE